MARQRMVTRTIKAYTAHCMTVDTETATVGTADLTFTGAKPSNIDKALVQHSTGTLKYVAVQSWDESEELWGMKEEDFMKYAVRVERNTNKVLDGDEDTTD